MEREKFLSSIYLIIKNDKGEVLLQRRQGTKLWPGFLALPAGHIDEGENQYEKNSIVAPAGGGCRFERSYLLRFTLRQ